MILASGSLSNHVLAWTVAGIYLMPAVVPRMALGSARLLVMLALLMHAVLLGVGWLGGAPRFGFAPALSITVWLVGCVYAVESQFYPQLRIRRVMCVLAAISVLMPLAFPGAALHPSASVWLPLHLALGVACYGLFGAAVVHAWLMGRAESRMRHASETDSGVPLLTLERLTFRFVGSGFVLLTATLGAGLLFGDALYGPGKALRLDHKTVFSVLSWLTFAALLLGRARYGWRGRRAVRVLYAGTGLLFLAYVGSRFVMEVFLGRMA